MFSGSRLIHSALLCGKRIVCNTLWRNNLLLYCSVVFKNGWWKLLGIIKWKKMRIEEKVQQKHFHTKASSFWYPVRAMQTWSWVLCSPCILSNRVILRNLLFNKFLGYVEVKCRGKGWVLAISHGATQDENWMGTWPRSSVWILSSEPSFGMQYQRKGMIILNVPQVCGMESEI